ncbi:MAG: HAD hydrolase-like protein, partial [Candidatus Limnocylindrus sp.]
AAGVRSILMLTGVTSREDAERAAALGGSARPTRVARDADDLARILAEMRAV